MTVDRSGFHIRVPRNALYQVNIRPGFNHVRKCGSNGGN